MHHSALALGFDPFRELDRIFESPMPGTRPGRLAMDAVVACMGNTSHLQQS